MLAVLALLGVGGFFAYRSLSTWAKVRTCPAGPYSWHHRRLATHVGVHEGRHAHARSSLLLQQKQKSSKKVEYGTKVRQEVEDDWLAGTAADPALRKRKQQQPKKKVNKSG